MAGIDLGQEEEKSRGVAVEPRHQALPGELIRATSSEHPAFEIPKVTKGWGDGWNEQTKTFK